MVRDEHERRLAATPEEVGQLIDSLAGPMDRLWPADRWPAMRFDGPLSVGARGGHGPIRYHIEGYAPGELIRFRFEAPAGFEGYHEYAAVPLATDGTILRHSLVMRTAGPAWLSWPLLYKPLHDAVIEDSLDKASRSLGLEVRDPQRWSWPVRCLRALAQRGRDRSEQTSGRIPASGTAQHRAPR